VISCAQCYEQKFEFLRVSVLRLLPVSGRAQTSTITFIISPGDLKPHMTDTTAASDLSLEKLAEIRAAAIAKKQQAGRRVCHSERTCA
jgi:hypothetical protein